MSEAAAAQEVEGSGGFLGWIERVGNKVPHPAMIFLGLIVGVIVLSAIMSWAGVSVTTDVAEPEPTADETATVKPAALSGIAVLII